MPRQKRTATAALTEALDLYRNAPRKRSPKDPAKTSGKVRRRYFRLEDRKALEAKLLADKARQHQPLVTDQPIAVPKGRPFFFVGFEQTGETIRHADGTTERVWTVKRGTKVEKLRDDHIRHAPLTHQQRDKLRHDKLAKSFPHYAR